ncbi:DUF721 domain-containing protein [Antarcticibacterium arcticum]|uniref:DUF721 domain-containing protein n=1 Tax=Antarcticibacterium arcticum TaxID=2585771 RepID=A0A5B8YNM7_9FLAO|nr:DUF721 domain-containing protein [Antarcticibacterium arcticum]QED37409.1 DUF721 domain-containing protein [Antarcticibacterium arcticum]
MKRNNENLKLSEALQDFVSKNKLQTGLDKVNARDVWNEQMGPAIEKYTTSLKLDGSTLYVQLSSSVLREELSYGKEKIVRLLNEALGKDLINKIVLR